MLPIFCDMDLTHFLLSKFVKIAFSENYGKLLGKWGKFFMRIDKNFPEKIKLIKLNREKQKIKRRRKVYK
jgi:hypothetical protein